ncbi:acyltransferase [Adhaeretor mobilis]|uniref:dTDP-3-amino-3,6-dideoxy-alpha-D-galactopyranose 3-N-acetyltransferase n=1 Tax=Adhaeretor mobilis TaxID=1930276 RepID=A0A517MVV0_9BACT|nr:acyltransferase [Adhaeretor mobilis]QDS99005.1 dTDP-3-amino-3,6-dideoxy-alpha-D-galactopyranose 3-N-acetyltransferase [Adhaeretor mobilis]
MSECSTQLIHETARVHETAMVEGGVQLGRDTSVWDNAHIRKDSVLGDECIVGGKSYIAYEVQIGHRVKINAMVYICYGVTIEDGVMISAGTIFTNDVFPRSTTPDLLELRSSDPDEETRRTVVAEGATIGAGCIIGSDLKIGRFAMVGMGSVVTRDVSDFHLVVGNPAKSVGCVCRCGKPLLKWPEGAPSGSRVVGCQNCQRSYKITDGQVSEQLASEGS